MRYPHFEMLPEDAFQHCGNGKIRLHGGGNPFGFVSDAVSSIGNAFESVIGGVGDALSGLDDWVRDEIPGGWLLPAAAVASVATGGGSLAALGEAETAAAAEAGGGAAIGESIPSSITQTLVDSGIPFNTAVNLTSASTLATNAAINAATQALMTGKVDPEALIKSLATGAVSSVVGGVVSNATGGIDNKLLSSIVGSAVQGATGALIAGKNPVTSALASALAGGVGYSIQGSGIPQSAVTTLVRTLASGQSIQNALVSAAVSEGSAFLKPYIKEAFQQFSSDKKDEAGEAFDKSVDSQVKLNKYIDENRENIKQIQLDQSLLDDEANKEKLSNFQGLIDTYNKQKEEYEEDKRIFNNYDTEMASRGYERLVNGDGDPVVGDGWGQRTGGHWVTNDEGRVSYEPNDRYEDGNSIRYIPAPSRDSFRDAANSAVGEANATGETLNRMYENEGVKDLITAHDRLVTNAEKFNAGYDPLFSDLNDYQAKLSNIVTTDKIADYFANEYSANVDQTRTTGQSATTDQTGTTQAETAQAETTQGGATQAGTVTGDQVATNAVITPVADASSPSGYYASGTTTPVNADGSMWVPSFTDSTGTNVAANAILPKITDNTVIDAGNGISSFGIAPVTYKSLEEAKASPWNAQYKNITVDADGNIFGEMPNGDPIVLGKIQSPDVNDDVAVNVTGSVTGASDAGVTGGGDAGASGEADAGATGSVNNGAIDTSNQAANEATNISSENVQTATSGADAGSAAGSDAGTSGGVTSGVIGGVADGVTGGVSDGVAGSVAGGVTEGVTGGTGTTAVGDAGSAGDAGTSGTTGDTGTSGATGDAGTSGTTGDAGTSGTTGDAGVTGGSSSGNVNIDARIDELVQQGIDLRTALEQALKESKDAADKAAADKAAADAKILLDKEKEQRALAAQTGYELVMPSAEALAYTPQTAPTFKSPFMSSPIMKTGEFAGPLTAFLKQVQKGDYTQDLYAQQKEEPVKQTQEPQMSSSYFNYGQDSNIDQILGQSSSVDPMYKTELLTAKKGGLATPLMAGGGTTRYGRYAGGGLNVVNHEGKNRIDFRTGDAVTGPGDGQSDDIPAMLADGEFVFPADVVAALGNGSTKAGSDKLYEMMHSIRSHARSAGPKDLPPPAKSPLDYLKKSRKARR